MYFDKLSDLGIKLTRRGGQEKCKCPQCSDSRKNKADRPLSVNITTGEYRCHNCGWKGNVRAIERKREVKKYEKPSPEMIKNIQLKESVVNWFKNRAISEKTLDKFFIFVRDEWMPQAQKQEACIGFPYFRNGDLVNVKFRSSKKGFKMVKDAELILYNLQSVGERKKCVIVEGEIDCMSVDESGFLMEQMVDKESGEMVDMQTWCCLSVPNGASKGNQKLEYLDNCSDWLAGFEEIIIASDGDEAGESLRDELVRRLGVEVCKTISYPIEEIVPTVDCHKRRCKDLNEVLMYLGAESVCNVLKNAQSIPVDGVYYLEDIFPSMLENFKRGIQLAPTTRFGEMDDYFRWKKGESNLFTGYGNAGKTIFLLQLMLTKSIYDDWKWAVFSPENFPANDFYDDLVEMYVGKWLQNMTEAEYSAACHFINEHIYYIYPEDGHDLISIHDRFRHLVLKKGIDGVMVDPFNQLDHLQKAFQREDQYLSDIFKDMKRFALMNSVCYNVIAHPKNPVHQKGQPLPVVDIYDMAGGAMWGNKFDNIVSYYRTNFHLDKNDPMVKVFVQKIKRKRTGGKLGDFDLMLDWTCKRFKDPVTGTMYCDPLRAKTISNIVSQENIWLPYKDEFGNDTDPF